MDNNPGSSPRIRGEYSTLCSVSTLLGIIPANTGRMRIPVQLDTGLGDHPREYGENDETVLIEPHESGSSPRIRGEYSPYQGPITLEGIIPANTGRIPSLWRGAL